MVPPGTPWFPSPMPWDGGFMPTVRTRLLRLPSRSHALLMAPTSCPATYTPGIEPGLTQNQTVKSESSLFHWATLRG